MFVNAIDRRLAEIGIDLPEAAPPMAALLTPTRLVGNRLVVSAQTPKLGRRIVYTGKVGAELDLATGQLATRLCALNVIAHARAALGGDLGRIAAVVQLRGYVNVAPGFHQIAEVVNGASQVILDIFGPEVGAHCRTAVGAAGMPFDVAAEVEAEFLTHTG
ncbi:MAG: RidA family protein [Gemmobacter sp.]